jgi:LysM repeat protein
MKKIIVGILVCALLLPLGAHQVWASPPANPIVHIVQWGENLTSIARRYGTTIQAIMVANNIGNQNRIYAGQRLIIPTGAPTPVPVASGCSYVVQYGDTLSGIASRFGVTISAIMRANGITNPNRIYARQRLAIPCASQPPYSPPPAPIPVPGGSYYIVQRGDTLAKIAVRFGVSIWSIVQANNIANPNIIHVGQHLFISERGEVTEPEVSVVGCEHLTFPRSGAVLRGVIEARGTADLTNFWYYKLEFRKDGLDEWHYITGSQTPVHNGALGQWDTRSVVDGNYIFRIVVVDRNGNYPPACEVAVHLDNDP